jgi:hypothetical protein
MKLVIRGSTRNVVQRSAIIIPTLTLVHILFRNPVRTSKRTPHFIITKINWLTLFKEVIAVSSENHAKPINTKYSIADYQSRWLI